MMSACFREAPPCLPRSSALAGHKQCVWAGSSLSHRCPARGLGDSLHPTPTPRSPPLQPAWARSQGCQEEETGSLLGDRVCGFAQTSSNNCNVIKVVKRFQFCSSRCEGLTEAGTLTTSSEGWPIPQALRQVPDCGQGLRALRSPGQQRHEDQIRTQLMS